VRTTERVWPTSDAFVTALRDDGMLADQIAWIEPDGAARLHLN
jgi:hypothetical protein